MRHFVEDGVAGSFEVGELLARCAPTCWRLFSVWIFDELFRAQAFGCFRGCEEWGADGNHCHLARRLRGSVGVGEAVVVW